MKQLLLICAVVVLVGCGPLITDPILEKAIRAELEKPTGELTEADLEEVTKLRLSYNQLTDVTGLEKLTNLKYLELNNNQLTEVPKGLEKLTQLLELSLDSNQLTEVPKGLEKLTQLNRLNLLGNRLTDVTGLEKLTQLTWLHLSSNQLTDVKGLEKLTQLEYLYLTDNQLTNVKGLEKLTQLTYLNLSKNPDLTKAQIVELKKALPRCEIYPLTKEESAEIIEAAIRKAAKKPTGELTKADFEKVTMLYLEYKKLTSVKGLEKLTKVERLNLRDNKLTDVNGLEKLTQLEKLYLDHNQLTDVNGLEKLTQLEYLNLRDNPDLTKAQIAELQKALPNCKISSNP